MVRIISDTSTLYNTAQAQEAGFDVAPLSVTIADETYQEFDEISAESFVDLIRQGHMPISSQPSIGRVAALFDKYPHDEILNISMADGLSGTYQSANAAAQLCEHSKSITVLNSRTLCGPHRHMVETAVKMAQSGCTVAEILPRIHTLMDSAKSFLIPSDFAYLRRGGRLSPLVSYVGQAIRLLPIMTQTEDARHLTVAGVKRTFAQAIEAVEKKLTAQGVDKNWRLYITHADAPELAQQACTMLKKAFPQVAIDIFPLSPAFITQGGPGCLAVQTVLL